MMIIRYMVWLVCLLQAPMMFANPSFSDDFIDKHVASLVMAKVKGEITPVLSARQEAALSELQAYAIQTDVVKRVMAVDKPVGFKAGLTSKAGQKKFASDGPVAGVLIEPALLAGKNVSVTQGDYHRMMLEMELGFTVNQRIHQTIDSVAQLKALVSGVLPVIEIPDLGFDKPLQLTAVDIIASNVAAKYWIKGVTVNPDSFDINRLAVQLRLKGQLVMEGSSDEVMGDQWQALLWLINRMVENGWAIEPGQVLITGAIGKMMLAESGDYVGDFSPLGEIAFSVNP